MSGWRHLDGKQSISVQVAKLLLQDGVVEEMSLDHDLGEAEPTGNQFVLWMAETGHWPKKKPAVHSANSPGRDSMRAYINRYYPKEESDGQQKKEDLE
jgi:hypothetical protein